MSTPFNNEYFFYKPADFFMLRIPLLSIEKYKDIFVDENFEDQDIKTEVINLFSELMIKEAVEVSSFSLFESLNKLTDGKKLKDKKIRKIISSFLKYVIRMTSRTTPYGIFAGVSLGSFGDKTKVSIGDNKYAKKRIRPDMEWLYGIIKMLEGNDEILNNLYITSNDLNFINGSRLDIGYISNCYKTSENALQTNNISASVRYTSQVKLVIEKSKQKIKYYDLINILKLNNPKADESKIYKFLRQLLENEYIITELRPPLSDTNSFEYILSKIKNINSMNEIYLKLLNIKKLMDYYNNSLIGEGIDLYSKIVSEMKLLYKCSNYLQVDMSIKENGIILKKDVVKDLQKAINVLVKLSSKLEEPYYISKYKDEFIEKYGIDREIPIIELFDEDKGIGAPMGYKMPPSRRIMNDTVQNKDNVKFNEYIINKILNCIFCNEKEVVITDKDIDKIEINDHYTIDELPRGFDINIFLAAKSLEEIDKGNYRIFIGPNFGSNGVGKTFGRFVDILPFHTKNKLKYLNSEEQNIVGNNVILSEITFMPQKGRTSNIMISWNPRDYEVPISTNCNNNKKYIPVSDLYIGIDSSTKKFYIKSKKINKRILITSGHMLNYSFGSNIYRFLREISDLNCRNIADNVLINKLNDFYYIPRIRYDKVIITPSTWKLSDKILNINLSELNKSEFYDSIKLWKNKWNIPQFVYLKYADNRLLLNLNNVLHLNELLYALKKSSEIVITEVENSLDNSWVRSTSGSYFAEFSIPFILNKQMFLENYTNEKRNIESDYTNMLHELNTKQNINILSTYDDRRIFFPGTNWLYLKLYGNSNRLNEFIGLNMLPFCSELINIKGIYKYFFIKYSDPDIHIRLRLNGDNNILMTQIMPKLEKWFEYLKNDGLLSRVCIDTYMREVERYGGLELIDLAENIFYFDSIMVSKIIQLKRMGQLNIDIRVIAVSSIINIMEELNIDYILQKNIFEKLYNKGKFRKIFQDNRNEYINAANSNNDWNSLRKLDDGLLLYDIFNIRKKSLNIYSNKLFKLDSKNELWNNKLDIILSLIHMHCNRLLELGQEEMIMELTSYTLHALNYYKKYNH